MTRKLQQERQRQAASTAPLRTELADKGYTKDAVVVECANPYCDHKVVCKWTRCTTRGINFGRPVIEIPPDWTAVLTYGASKQDVLCPSCDISDLPQGILLR